MVSGVICSAVNLFGSEYPVGPLGLLVLFFDFNISVSSFLYRVEFLVTQLLRSASCGVLLLSCSYLTVTWLPGISHGSFDFYGGAHWLIFFRISRAILSRIFTVPAFSRSCLWELDWRVCVGACQARRLPNSIKRG